MGALGNVGGGGSCAFEQFIHYDPSDKESVRAAIKHMHDAKKDAIGHGYLPGKENLYLKMAMTDEQLSQEYANSSQPIVFHLQRKIRSCSTLMILEIGCTHGYPNLKNNNLGTWHEASEYISLNPC